MTPETSEGRDSECKGGDGIYLATVPNVKQSHTQVYLYHAACELLHRVAAHHGGTVFKVEGGSSSRTIK